MPSDRRWVPIPVDDPRVTHVNVTPLVQGTPTSEGYMDFLALGGYYRVPVPSDDQLTRDLWNAVGALEAEAADERKQALMYGPGSSYFRKHTMRAKDAQASADRLRSHFRLDDEGRDK